MVIIVMLTAFHHASGGVGVNLVCWVAHRHIWLIRIEKFNKKIYPKLFGGSKTKQI